MRWTTIHRSPIDRIRAADRRRSDRPGGHEVESGAAPGHPIAESDQARSGCSAYRPPAYMRTSTATIPAPNSAIPPYSSPSGIR